MQQPVLPASLAYVLLCFNVVLAPGGLMTAFLTQHGMDIIKYSFDILCYVQKQPFKGVFGCALLLRLENQYQIFR